MLEMYLHTEATCDEECDQDLQCIVLDDPSLIFSTPAQSPSHRRIQDRIPKGALRLKP
jgi:hypothetical protein